jgi:hypothetical protein
VVAGLEIYNDEHEESYHHHTGLFGRRRLKCKLKNFRSLSADDADEGKRTGVSKTKTERRLAQKRYTVHEVSFDEKASQLRQRVLNETESESRIHDSGSAVSVAGRQVDSTTSNPRAADTDVKMKSRGVNTTRNNVNGARKMSQGSVQTQIDNSEIENLVSRCFQTINSKNPPSKEKTRPHSLLRESEYGHFYVREFDPEKLFHRKSVDAGCSRNRKKGVDFVESTDGASTGCGNSKDTANVNKCFPLSNISKSSPVSTTTKLYSTTAARWRRKKWKSSKRKLQAVCDLDKVGDDQESMGAAVAMNQESKQISHENALKESTVSDALNIDLCGEDTIQDIADTVCCVEDTSRYGRDIMAYGRHSLGCDGDYEENVESSNKDKVLMSILPVEDNYSINCQHRHSHLKDVCDTETREEDAPTAAVSCSESSNPASISISSVTNAESLNSSTAVCLASHSDSEPTVPDPASASALSTLDSPMRTAVQKTSYPGSPIASPAEAFSMASVVTSPATSPSRLKSASPAGSPRTRERRVPCMGIQSRLYGSSELLNTAEKNHQEHRQPGTSSTFIPERFEPSREKLNHTQDPSQESYDQSHYFCQKLNHLHDSTRGNLIDNQNGINDKRQLPTRQIDYKDDSSIEISGGDSGTSYRQMTMKSATASNDNGGFRERSGREILQEPDTQTSLTPSKVVYSPAALRKTSRYQIEPFDSSVPNNGTRIVTPEHVQRNPENASTKIPENAKIVPENPSTGTEIATSRVPENVKRVPENVKRVPKNIQRVPENIQRVPENVQWVPGQNVKRVPENVKIYPENVPAVLREGSRVGFRRPCMKQLTWPGGHQVCEEPGFHLANADDKFGEQGSFRRAKSGSINNRR